MASFCQRPPALGAHVGSEWSWGVRIHSDGLLEWFERLLINGTYPAVPWLSYTILGSIIADLKENRLVDNACLLRGFCTFTFYTVLASIVQNENWALTEGEAVLTFFPANSEFVIVSATFVILLHMMLEKMKTMSEGRL